MTFIIVIHVIACIALIALVLIQRGRGSGLVESFSGVESMFGTKTSVFLTRLTTILSVIFFISCLSLAILSVRQSRSLMKDVKAPEVPVGQEAQPPVAQKEVTQEPMPKPQEQPQAQPPAPPEVPKTEQENRLR